MMCVRALGAGETVETVRKAHWAFVPVTKPGIPKVDTPSGVANPIDAFLLQSLSQRGITPNAGAGKREILRRLYLGMTGLPPTHEEITAFVSDSRPDAWARWVDHVLSLPAYGERWGRHWLDVVRFAQSNGYERDGEKPMAWRYRDYVIKAFNEDKPYDLFVREHIAGDLMNDPGFDAVIATGFQRLGVWDDEPDDKQLAEYEELDDMLSTTGTAFLGVTIGCARCHDHKFDPFSQKDYYQLLAFFRQVRPAENAKYVLDSANYVPLEPPGRIQAWEDQRRQQIEGMEAELKTAKSPDDKKRIEERLKQAKELSPPFQWALAARERTNPPPTHLLSRGRPSSPGAVVLPGFPAALGEPPPGSGPSIASESISGRRMELAQWIADRRNPLTARVFVNRLWHHHFGQGLVTTTTDFGKVGAAPSHPELLDWLAAEFMNSGWSIKHMHRLMLGSEAYRRSSESRNARAQSADPANRLLWRQSLRRVEAEVIRDSMLAVSGNLNRQSGGRGFFPDLAGEVHAGASRPGQDWEKMTESQASRRSVYAYVRRTTAIPALETFDYNNTTSPLGERPVTTVAPQALLMLNDPFVKSQASALALRSILESGPSLSGQIRRAYSRTLSRLPTESELATAQRFVERQAESFMTLDRRVTFKPDVPSSLLSGFMNQLNPRDFLTGPSNLWSYHRGIWSKPYEGIRTVDRNHTPFALYQGTNFQDGVVETQVLLDRSTETFSLLLRSAGKDDVQSGYELAFDARGQRVSLRRHGQKLEVLADKEASIPLNRLFLVRIEARGPRVRLWMNGAPEPTLDVIDPEPMLVSGQFGVRCWGAPMSLERATLKVEQSTHEIPGAWHHERLRPGPPPSKEQWARDKGFEAFCLLLLNLNEFVYVD